MTNKVVDMLRQVLQASYIENDQYNKTLGFEEIESLVMYVNKLEYIIQYLEDKERNRDCVFRIKKDNEGE